VAGLDQKIVGNPTRFAKFFVWQYGEETSLVGGWSDNDAIRGSSEGQMDSHIYID
jgi:hypothetical protein